MMKTTLEKPPHITFLKRGKKEGFFVLLVALALWPIFAHSFCQEAAPSGFELVKKILVVGSTAWTDTGLDVQKGQEHYFRATGTVSLQKDNPVASCGPEGLNLRTMQQPLPDRNLGALIGKVREKVEVSEDKQTGEKTSREIGEVFFIGKDNWIFCPSAGRLLLGVNENVSGDNEGGFEVKIYARKSMNPKKFR